jgi:hypothetical protein
MAVTMRMGHAGIKTLNYTIFTEALETVMGYPMDTLRKAYFFVPPLASGIQTNFRPGLKHNGLTSAAVRIW